MRRGDIEPLPAEARKFPNRFQHVTIIFARFIASVSLSLDSIVRSIRFFVFGFFTSQTVLGSAALGVIANRAAFGIKVYHSGNFP